MQASAGEACAQELWLPGQSKGLVVMYTGLGAVRGMWDLSAPGIKPNP